MSFGSLLPQIVTPIPGPRSRELAQRLSRAESRNITSMQPHPPIFWQDARGANVRDVDGNIYIDLTSGFGVATAGHANAAVISAITEQAQQLPHALGDVYPAAVKVRLLEKLAGLMPGDLSVSILGNSGAEAVEAALKTAVLRTGRTGLIAFENAYHGLTYGALSVTHRAHFRTPFEKQLFADVHFARFDRLDDVDRLLKTYEIGAVIVEPIQGRGGINVPGGDFLAQLRARCDGRRTLLIFDEIYTGCGRTGRWLACEHWNVVPDVVVIGKGLSGALPISACIGTREVMDAWPASTGEAIHTSTFLGNPAACAAALAQLDEIEKNGLLERAQRLGSTVQQRFVNARGLGLMQGIPSEHASDVCASALQEGVLVLAEGSQADVLAITPPSVITDEQLSHALTVIERHIR